MSTVWIEKSNKYPRLVLFYEIPMISENKKLDKISSYVIFKKESIKVWIKSVLLEN